MSKRSLSSRVKITLLKGMEVIGTSASNLASNAKLRVNEINLENRRREILTDFSLQAFELWQKGVQLPDPLSEMLKELSEIENRLSVLRAQKYSKAAGADQADASDAETSDAACVCEFDGDAAVTHVPPVPDETISETSSPKAEAMEEATAAADDPETVPEAPNTDVTETDQGRDNL